MNKKLFVFAPILALVIFVFATTKTYAIEGAVELRNTQGETTRCQSYYVLLQDYNFNILVSCRDLIYPVDSSFLSYVIWATPTKGGNAIKLGNLGFGTGYFRTNQPFSSLFVTTEKDPNTRTPQGDTVMRGNIEPAVFLERQTTPTPTSAAGSTGNQTVTPTKTETTTSKLLLGLQRAGILSIIALVAIIGLVFVITRARG